eukprot:GEMP01010405.1.p1 GENE.GEMP01010405.1~~GEMP01010405.1.p1  ORF type:complete len:362 (+),score=73.73 GEMP01010405.1:1179-2264(+)
MGSHQSGVFGCHPSSDVSITPASQDWCQELHSTDCFQCPKQVCDMDYSPFGTPSFRLEGCSHRSLIKGGPKMLTWFLEVFLFAQAILMSFLVLFLIYYVKDAYDIALCVFGCSGIVLNLLWLIPKITQAVVIVLSVEHMKDKALIEEIELETREERKKEQILVLRQARDEVWFRRENRHLQSFSTQYDVPEEHESTMKAALINPPSLRRLNTLSPGDNLELQSAFGKSCTKGFVLRQNAEIVFEHLGIKDEDTLATLTRILANYGNRLSVHDFDEALARLGEEEEACVASSKMDQALFEYLCDGEPGGVISVNKLEKKFLECGIVAPHQYFAEESVREAFGELKAYLTHDEFLIWCRFHEL